MRFASNSETTVGKRLRSAVSASAFFFAASTSALGQGGQTEYEYDELGRLIKVTYENGKVIDYGFDAAGNRTNQTISTGGSGGGAVSFSINDVSVSEGGTLNFTISKAGSASQSHSVTYATANGSAIAGSDYTSKSGTMTFTTSQSSQTLSVSTIEDSSVEPNETMYVNLSNATGGATISDSQGTGTINNDDSGGGSVSFSINNVSVSEGGTLSFTVSKSGSASQSHSVSYATANGTATAGSDYTSKSGTLTFTTSQTSRTVTVSTIEDTTYENGETVLVNLSGATGGATISDSQGSGTISNDDAAPSFAINDTSVSEGGTLTFTVSKSGSTALSHNVSYATANGTAIAGSDYTAKSGTLTFTSGQTSQPVNVATIEDTAVEPNETMVVNLSNATAGATLSDSQGTGTINNDDTGNQPPIAVDDFSDVQAFGTRVVSALNNDSDPDNDPLTIISVQSPLGGTATIIDGGTRVRYTNTSSGIGSDDFGYTISDGNGGTATATISVTVNNPGGQEE